MAEEVDAVFSKLRNLQNVLSSANKSIETFVTIQMRVCESPKIKKEPIGDKTKCRRIPTKHNKRVSALALNNKKTIIRKKQNNEKITGQKRRREKINEKITGLKKKRKQKLTAKRRKLNIVQSDSDDDDDDDDDMYDDSDYHPGNGYDCTTNIMSDAVLAVKNRKMRKKRSNFGTGIIYY